MVVVVSYATENFSQAAALLKKSSKHFGVHDVRVYGPGDAVIADLRRAQPEIMAQPRGAGYWLWKPFIIADVLSKVPDQEFVLYLDSAMTFVGDPSCLTRALGSDDICLFQQYPAFSARMSMWTKRDCFVALDADTEEYWSSVQLAASFQLYRAGARAREFVSALGVACCDRRALTDESNQLGKPNLPDFVDHRHDQSVLTILAQREGVRLLPDPSQFGPWCSEDKPPAGLWQVFHQHRSRKLSLKKYIRARLRRDYTGGRYFL
ncbi:hypothetical protein [Martelella sp. HB161492]|uniref:hypothetical protein n=1 Tax=Martelella sp. HB161492 TaxID=2720726 RepID=UPI001590E7DC|nr:hypothetical protein [Martelella sp. HB161492]